MEGEERTTCDKATEATEATHPAHQGQMQFSPAVQPEVCSHFRPLVPRCASTCFIMRSSRFAAIEVKLNWCDLGPIGGGVLFGVWT